MDVIQMNENNKYETLQFGITVEEARKQLQLVKLDGFPAIRFKRKIIVNGKKLQEWFDQNYGEYGGYSYKK